MNSLANALRQQIAGEDITNVAGSLSDMEKKALNALEELLRLSPAAFTKRLYQADGPTEWMVSPIAQA